MPKYCENKRSKQAFVDYRGRRYYIGVYNSVDSLERYHRFVAEWHTAGGAPSIFLLTASEPIAHSTVQTLLRGLEEKGAVSHETEGRTFVFFPLVEEDRFKQCATRDLVERVFGGNAGTLVAHLLKNEKVSRREIDEIRKLIDRRGKK